MKREAIAGALVSLFAMILLLIYTPDSISLIFVLIMCAIAVCGYYFGILQLGHLGNAFRTGRRSIEKARNVQTKSPWYVLKNEEHVFGNKLLDEEFRRFCGRVEEMGESGSLILPVEAYINPDLIALHTWRNLVSQIPGTMTSLGVLGTFLGLILGIDGLGFSSLNLAVESIENLLNGIELAFYTSIAGVILSVIFNLTYHMVWERSMQEMELFLRDFHRYVIPSQEDALLRKKVEFMDHVTKELTVLSNRLEVIEKK